MLIRNVRIFTVTDGVVENGYILCRDGKIAEVGEMKNCPAEQTEFFDGTGLSAYPGFIDGHSHLGMFGDCVGFEAEDGNEESQPITPHLRAIDAINPLDYCFGEALDAGVTCVVTGPGSANPIAGQMAAVKTSGKCIDEMIVKAPVCMKLALGENPKSVYGEKKQAPVTRMATAAMIRTQLKKAQIYAAAKKEALNKNTQPPEYDMKCEALLPVLEKEIPVQIHAHRCDDIFTAIRLAEEFDFKYMVVHATQGCEIAVELAQKGARVLAGPLICDRSKPELKGLTPRLPAVLDNNGVQVCIVTDHPVIPVQYLALCAGLAVREGLPYNKALEAITINPAAMNGIDGRVGSIEVGKDADIVLFSEDPLTVSAKPAAVFINGNKVRG